MMYLSTLSINPSTLLRFKSNNKHTHTHTPMIYIICNILTYLPSCGTYSNYMSKKKTTESIKNSTAQYLKTSGIDLTDSIHILSVILIAF